MVHSTAEQLMRKNRNIRNVSIITCLNHDRPKLISSLVAAPGAIGQEIATEFSYTSICYDMDKKSQNSWKGERDGNTFLINLLDAPGNLDHPSQATAELSITDGAVVMVDKGALVHPDGLIGHALCERIKTVLCVNILDSVFSGSHLLDGEEVYQTVYHAVQDVNNIMETHDDKVLGDMKFYPQKGVVAFCSTLDEWGFTLRSFANMYRRHFGFSEAEMMDKLWGDHFYDVECCQWTSVNTRSRHCVRGFVEFCYKPIKRILDSCTSNDKESLRHLLCDVDADVKVSDEELRGEQLMKHVMSSWLPIGKSVLDMVIYHLPSPLQAQQYRVENLYKGPLNDAYANAIRNCDPAGPLMMYISKKIPSDKGRSIAFGRVFCGTVATGMKIRIIGPDHVPGQNKNFYVEFVQKTICWIGKNQGVTKSVPPGNVTALDCLDECIPINNTVTSEDESHMFPIERTFVAMADITLSPVGGKEMKQFFLPYVVHNSLYPHQRDGVRWLWSMHCNHQGALLADDMGLGKTRQVCVFLHGLFHSRLIKKALIIAPLSVIGQWAPEFKQVGVTNIKKFTNAKTHQKLLNSVHKEGGVLLTTYGVFQNHYEEIVGENEKAWDYLFMDEGHRAKNPDGNIAKSLNKIKCAHKIMMTGTPMQNNLKEFFTLMEICDPNVLGSFNEFQLKYIYPIDRGKHKDATLEWKIASAEAINKLKETIKPIYLRRTKALLKETGRLDSNKYEYTVWLKLSPSQIQYYTALINDQLLRTKGAALAASDVAQDICRHPSLLNPKKSKKEPEKLAVKTENGNVKKKRDIAILMKKRLLDLFPLHLDRPDELGVSSKLNFIVYIVPIFIEQGHKTLIFSQSPGFLELMESALADVMDKERIVRMDGSTRTRDREKLKKAFQCENLPMFAESSDSQPSSSSTGSSSETNGSNFTTLDSSVIAEPLVFLMTTQVGGVGLTLTQACRVIIADPAENPSEDNQAVDRAYRIGQKKDVVVYRLMSCAVIEEHTYREQIIKVESSISLFEEQCMKGICKKEGLVFSLPPKGFEYCRTHCELVDGYGSNFDVSASKLELYHESVVAISNHSLLFTLKEKPLEVDANTSRNLPKQRTGLKGSKSEKNLVGASPVENESQSVWLEVSPYIIYRLRVHGNIKLKELGRTSGALLKIFEHNHSNQVLITGFRHEIEKAQLLIEEFINEVKVEKMEILNIPKDKVGLVIGKNGETIQNMMKSSDAYIEVKDTGRELKDVVIRGRSDHEIQTARGLILEKVQRRR